MFLSGFFFLLYPPLLYLPAYGKPGLQHIKGQINFLITVKLPDLIDGLAGMFLIKLPMCLVQTLSLFRQEQRAFVLALGFSAADQPLILNLF